MTNAGDDLSLKDYVIPLSRRTCIMGILNVTPDSFSDGGQFFDTESAIEHGLRMAGGGAAMDSAADSGSKTAQIKLKRSQKGTRPTTPSMKVLTYQRPVLEARIPNSQRSRWRCVRRRTLAASAKHKSAAMNEVWVRASTAQA